MDDIKVLCVIVILSLAFYCGVVFQRNLQRAEMQETVDLYNRLVKLQDRLTELMNEVESCAPHAPTGFMVRAVYGPGD